MQTTFEVTKEVTLSHILYKMSKGDIIVYTPENENKLVIYRQGAIVKTTTIGAGQMRAMVRTGMISPVETSSATAAEETAAILNATLTDAEQIESTLMEGELYAEKGLDIVGHDIGQAFKDGVADAKSIFEKDKVVAEADADALAAKVTSLGDSIEAEAGAKVQALEAAIEAAASAAIAKAEAAVAAEASSLATTSVADLEAEAVKIEAAVAQDIENAIKDALDSSSATTSTSTTTPATDTVVTDTTTAAATAAASKASKKSK